MASCRDFRLVTTSICPTLTEVDMRSTPPCGNTIIVAVCSSKGSVCGVTSRTTSVTLEPWTFTGISSETASARTLLPDCADFAGAPIFGTAASLVVFAASRVSLVSGAMIFDGRSRTPERKVKYA